MGDYLHLVPIRLANEPESQAHDQSRGCWCRPTFAIDCRGTYPGDQDLRVLLHRNPARPADEQLVQLRARKGVISPVPA